MKKLSPQNHPDTKGLYTNSINNKEIVYCSDAVSYPANSFEDRTHLSFIEPFLAAAQNNPSIPQSFIPLISKSLFYVLKVTPDAIGIVASAIYSGPRTTSLLTTLKNKSHGKAFAAEIIIAGYLITVGSYDINRKFLSICEKDRMDFGIKMNPLLPTRKTIEADIMVHFSFGKRIAIDTKYTCKKYYTGRISGHVLSGISNAINVQEINEFHYITNSKFTKAQKEMIAKVLKHYGLPSDAISLHEECWPIDKMRNASEGRSA